MSETLPIILAPHPIFRQKAEAVEKVDDEVKRTIARMFATLDAEFAVGIGANMVGLLKRIVVIHLRDEGTRLAMVNPVILNRSTETQTFEEASISFPGISAKVTRPKSVTVEYLDEAGAKQTLDAEGFLATVIQHEIDYLDGKIFVDYLSKMKKDMLLKKSEKFLKNNPPHVHTASCKH